MQILMGVFPDFAYGFNTSVIEVNTRRRYCDDRLLYIYVTHRSHPGVKYHLRRVVTLKNKFRQKG